MKLNRQSLQNKDFFNEAGISIPTYNIDTVVENTTKNPKWVHFGGGNIFRVFVANAVDKAISDNRMDSGIIIAESFDYEVIDKVYDPSDNLSLSVIMYSNGNLDLKVIGSLTETVKTDLDGLSRLSEIFINTEFQMVSFTVTEKGYSLKNMDGEYLGVVEKDFENGINSPIHVMSVVTSLLYKRFKSCNKPLAVVSMDNCSHNGDKIKSAIIEIAEKWVMNDLVEKDFLDYISKSISFPFTMIDKITPRPAPEIADMLSKKGLEDMDIVVTNKNTYTAQFVNAESAEYLIIEDDFPNGRPDFSNERVIFTTRDIVNKVETMKVTTCLNPLHTALAVYGVILGIDTISNETKDIELRKLIEKIGYDEGLKVVVNPGIIDPKAFIDEVINERFSNDFIIDTPQRIATDTSQKVGIRFGNTIEKYMQSEFLETSDLVGIPLAIAGWFRYLLCVDDNGDAFEPSPDPLLNELRNILANVKIGDSNVSLQKLLSNKDIFGIDLTSIELGSRIELYFNEMIKEKGSVRSTLKKYL